MAVLSIPTVSDFYSPRNAPLNPCSSINWTIDHDLEPISIPDTSKQINYFDLSSFILTLVAHLSEKKEERRIFRLLIKEKLSRVNIRSFSQVIRLCIISLKVETLDIIYQYTKIFIK